MPNPEHERLEIAREAAGRLSIRNPIGDSQLIENIARLRGVDPSTPVPARKRVDENPNDTGVLPEPY